VASFVPAADEVGHLQRAEDSEGRFFRGFCEKGHYAGRTEPTNTRQGIYAVTPGGSFLASVNTRNADAMIHMLEEALGKWEKLGKEERLGTLFQSDKSTRFERFYPSDGMVLRCVSRDLEEQVDLRQSDWRRAAWNMDYAWFRRDEVASMIPRPEVGAQSMMPDELALRLARCHLVDNVRGQTPAYGRKDIKRAEITFEVTEIDGEIMHLTIRGQTSAERGSDKKSGLECQLLGRAIFDGERFTAFELAALGRRWGGTRYNARDGQGESQLGIALVLDADAPRVAPANHWIYGWR
jgi:hypothetical protein